MSSYARVVRRLAQLDGRHVLLTDAGCCSTPELIVSPLATLEVLHDPACPSVDRDHPDYVTARAACGRAVARAYADLSGEAALSVLADRTGAVGAVTLAAPGGCIASTVRPRPSGASA